MAARRTPGPSVRSPCSTFSAPVSTEQSLPKAYVDFEKEYHQLVIRNKELSDANRKFKCNTSYAPIAVRKMSHRANDALAAENEKLSSAARYTNAMEYAELAVERVIKTRKFADDMENGDYEIPELDLGQRFHVQNVFGRRFGFGAYY
ncbi:hypothetical protein BOTCAL_0042g00130 [Botryotinia calthae]|uniref:Uncharacterized protein n=1 Tax=Botryotinia calthae TaxID=38488 RepID=A0A4Y8DC85_9HELO|nr:hypothetical protein BOTCAL_0042g00130 [Botryotinia calthae]